MSDWIRTELHNAAYNCDLEWVKIRIAAGDDVNARDSSNYTPLMWCAFRSMVGGEPVEVAKLLIDNGADPNAQQGGVSTYSVLNLAVVMGSLPVIEMLLNNGADVNQPAGDVTPLMNAAAGGDTEIVELLIRYGADIEQKIGSFTAVSYADHYGHEHLFDLLAL